MLEPQTDGDDSLEPLPTTYRNLLRCTIQVATWLLLLVVAFGSRSQFGVCRADACCSAADSSCTCGCCGCCAAEANPAPAGKTLAPTADLGLPALHAHGCTDCRLDLSLPLQPAPMPRPVHAPDLEPIAIAWFSAGPVQHPATAEPCPCPFDTGPPRPDGRTELLATTILRR